MSRPSRFWWISWVCFEVLLMEGQSRTVVKNTIFLYARMMILLVVSLYTSRIVLANLGVSDFGLYNVVGGLITIFAFINNSMSQATQRFITYALGENDLSSLRCVFSQSLYLHLLIALLIVILAETGGLWYFYNYLVIEPGRESAALVVFQVSILITLVTIIEVPFRATIVAYEKMNAFAYISLFEGLMKLLIAFVLSFTLYDKLIVYALLMLATSLITLTCYIVYAVSHFSCCRLTKGIEWGKVREMTSFAGWSMFGSLASAGYSQGLNLIINAFFNTTINAARGIAVQIQAVVRNFSGSFQMAINPQITKSYASNDRKYFYTLIYRGSLYSFFLYFLFAFPVFMEIDQFLGIWLVDVPPHTGNFVRIMLLISSIEVLASSLNVGIQATGKIKYLETIVSLILLMIVPSSYLALKFSSYPEVVFVVDLIFVILAHIARLTISKKLYSLSFREYAQKVILPIFSVVATSMILPTLLFFILPDNFWSAMAVIMTCLICSVFSILFIGFDKLERSQVLGYVCAKLHLKK